MAWLRVKEAAERAGVAASTIYQLCGQHRLTHARIGVGRGVIRISEESLQDYLKGATVGGGPAAEPPPPSPPQTLKHLRI